MPIDCAIPLMTMDQEAFHQVDHRVMAVAFSLHNELGRFLDEKLYRTELAHRCAGEGLVSQQEVTIRVSHDSFIKRYYVDVVIGDGALYELKAIEQLGPSQQTQMIHYLLLTDQRHGKLINFRPPSLEHRFVSTSLRREDRLQFRFERTSWRPVGPDSETVLGVLSSLLADWGTGLSLDLYRDALAHFFGGPETVLRDVEIRLNERSIGRQKMFILEPGVALHLSALTRNFATYRQHIHRLLCHADLRAIQWLNFNRNTVQCETITKD